MGLTIWGRTNSVNVQKALWCLAELDIAHERIDAGMAFGRNTEPDYLAMNPNGLVPTLEEALNAGQGVPGAHCIHELWMRGEFATHIETALEKLWDRAAAAGKIDIARKKC